MRLLLDTHVFLWWWAATRQLKPDVRNAIAHADVVYVSAASAWEIAIKTTLGRLRFEGSVIAAIESAGFEPLRIDFAHVERYRTLPRHHTDPFDRMLVAQAVAEGLRFITHDRALGRYAVDILWA